MPSVCVMTDGLLVRRRVYLVGKVISISTAYYPRRTLVKYKNQSFSHVTVARTCAVACDNVMTSFMPNALSLFSVNLHVLRLTCL